MFSFITALLFISHISYAQVSAFHSSVDGITVPNAHFMNDEGTVLRGMEPRKKVKELVDYGVTDVLIFKNSTKGEVEEEIELIKEVGLTSHHIPFKWKGFESEQAACEQVVEAINLIKKLEAKGKVVYFHCTVGEDRTGLLAGVYRLMTQGWSAQKAFKDEMCANGYADGNPKKPGMVTGAIHKELTPLFFALAEKIESGKKITKATCKGIALEKTSKKCK